MAEIHTVSDLKLSDDRIVKAHMCKASGHILMIPMCQLMPLGRPRDPWAKGRAAFNRVLAKVAAAATRADESNHELSSTPHHGQRAMHHSMVVPFLADIYGTGVDADSLCALVDACKEREAAIVAAEQAAAEQAAADDGNNGDGVQASTSSNASSSTTTSDSALTETDTTGSEMTSSEPTMSVDAEGSRDQNQDDPAASPSNVDEDAPFHLPKRHKVSSSTQSHPPQNDDRQDDLSVSLTPAPTTIDFEGVSWVDATHEWKNLPDGICDRRTNWHIRLGGVGISIAACRMTKVNNIASLTEARNGGTKSVYVPSTLWTAMVKRLRDGNGANNAKTSSARDGASSSTIRRRVDGELAEVVLEPGEEFRHDGVVLRIEMYGERTVAGMYADHSDLVKILGLKDLHNCPDVETFDARTTDGRDMSVVNFKGMVILWAVYARKSVVASALMDWVTDTVFCVQYGVAEPVRQGEYDTLVLADRSTRYSASQWALDGEKRSQGLYLDEVCSAELARERWPAQVDAALANLPEGTRLNDACVVKVGYTIDKSNRMRAIRTAMHKAFGADADTRIVSFSRCPGATAPDLRPLERNVLDAFDAYNFEGVEAYVDQKQVELFLVTRSIVRDMTSALSVQAAIYASAKVEGAHAQVDASDARIADAENRARVAREMLERTKMRIEAAEALSRERIESRDAQLAAAAAAAAVKDEQLAAIAAAAAAKDAEIKGLRKALARTLPSEMASILSGVLGMSDA
jgi:hypothetical protein